MAPDCQTPEAFQIYALIEEIAALFSVVPGFSIELGSIEADLAQMNIHYPDGSCRSLMLQPHRDAWEVAFLSNTRVPRTPAQWTLVGRPFAESIAQFIRSKGGTIAS